MMSGGGTSSSTTTQKLSPEQQAILGLVTPVFSSYFPTAPTGPRGKEQGTGEVNASVYPGSSVVGPNPLETLGQQMTLNTVPAIGTAAANALGGGDFLASGDVLDVMRNPGLQGAINAAIRPISENFGQTVLPAIRDDATLAGGYGGNRQGIAEGLASQGYLRQVGDTASNLVNQAYQSGLDAMTKGLALTPSLQQAALGSGATVAGVGAEQRAFEQAQLTDQIQRFYQEQFLPLMIAQQVAGTALGFPGGTTVTTQQGGGTSPVQMGLGGASSILSMLPFLMML